MGSPHNRRIYSDTTLFSLELAMRDVWEVLKAHAPRSDWDKDPGLQNALAEMMLDLVDFGRDRSTRAPQQDARELQLQAAAVGDGPAKRLKQAG